jgi:hypothetical protein
MSDVRHLLEWLTGDMGSALFSLPILEEQSELLQF